MLDLDIIENEIALPEIREWQIKQYYDKEEVEWLDKDTILLHGINEGRKFRVVRGTKEEKITRIKPQIPQAVVWHQATNWKHAKELYKNYEWLWNSWKECGYIPYHIIAATEKQ